MANKYLENDIQSKALLISSGPKSFFSMFDDRCI